MFRMIANLNGVGVDGSMGREIDCSDERAARINICDVSDKNVSVMCYDDRSHGLSITERNLPRTVCTAKYSTQK